MYAMPELYVDPVKMVNLSGLMEDSDIEGPDTDSETETSDSDTDPAPLPAPPRLPPNCSFTSIQTQVFHQIKNAIDSQKSAIISLNARSGTGKTYILTHLAMDYKSSVQYITFRKDQATEVSTKSKNTVNAFTYISFYTRCLKLPYSKALNLFNISTSKDLDLLYKLIVHSTSYANPDIKTIIVDSCTIPSAAMVILLYIISLTNKCNLIFAGNKIQLGAMHRSSQHGVNNLELIRQLSDFSIRRLTEHRSTDRKLTSKLAGFRKMIQQVKSRSEVNFYFNLRYYLYRCFRSKYFAQERFDTVYMAQFHKLITLRLGRYLGYLTLIGKSFFLSPFYVEKEGLRFPLEPSFKRKFPTALLLVEGQRYIHVDEKGVHKVVELVAMQDYTEAGPLSVLVRSFPNTLETIKRCKLNFYQILPAYRAWLVGRPSEGLHQFPLRPCTYTYHASLGRTLEDELVELDADCPVANTIYVGLCCVSRYENIHKIHADSSDLLSFIVNDYMRRERKDRKYYYRCPKLVLGECQRAIFDWVARKGTCKFIDNITWENVYKISKFEKEDLRKFVRIEREAYERNKAPVKDSTRLMKMAEFIKRNKGVVEEAVNLVNPEDVAQVLNHKKGELGFRETEGYRFLKEKFEGFEMAQEG